MGAIADAFAAYAQPLIDQTDGSFEQVQRALALGQLCYNAAILSEQKSDEVLGTMREVLKMDESEFEDFRRTILVPMIERHRTMFPNLHRRLQEKDAGLEITRAEPTSVPPAGKARPEIDRYAPCPCNSGEKYKFCCGRKGRK